MKFSEYTKAIHIAEALQNQGKKVTVNKIILSSVFIPDGSLTHVDKKQLKKVADMYKEGATTEAHLQRYKEPALSEYVATHGVYLTDTKEYGYRRVSITVN